MTDQYLMAAMFNGVLKYNSIFWCLLVILYLVAEQQFF